MYARIDAGLKENTEGILSRLGISPSSAIQMICSQIVLQKGMPFELRLHVTAPPAISAVSREALDRELSRGVESIRAGKTLSEYEVDAALAREFGI